MSNSVRTCITFKERADEAVKLYVSIFPNSRIKQIMRVEEDAGPLRKGQVLVAIFELDGREYRALDGGETFSFSEGFSLDVTCKTQEEVDRYWSALTANGGEEGPCGWLKDPFGVSWQIVPEQLGQMLGDPKSGNSEACLNAMLKMKKIDIAELERAYRGARVA
ncbi:MAG TPA: VOC family protein [Candidatus Dormibacteraeota bacterium]|nr:VOC family protein [Candidatus Dormibacteraeota bacterium]